MKSVYLIIVILTVGTSISYAQTSFASTEEFYVDFSNEVLEIQWGVTEDPIPTFNPFDSLEVVKSQTIELLNELRSPFEAEKYKSSMIIMETLIRLEYRMGLIELSIKAIEERLQLAEIKN